MTISKILQNIETVILQFTNLLFVVATAVFLWGVILYVIAGADEKKMETAKGFLIWGLIGLFVMFAMWGLVTVVFTKIFG